MMATLNVGAFSLEMVHSNPGVKSSTVNTMRIFLPNQVIPKFQKHACLKIKYLEE